MTRPRTSEVAGSPYAAVAHEYYDRMRHPTSAAFREASLWIVRSWWHENARDGNLVDIGAGRSVLAEVIDSSRLSSLALIDASRQMLRYSDAWVVRGARAIVASAESFPLDDHSVVGACASLADPFNTAAFWQELSRVLRHGGTAIFTTPSYEWASAYRTRSAENLHAAHFDLATGGSADVPSLIVREPEQIAAVADVRLNVREVKHFRVADLSTVPPKIRVLSDEQPVVTGYVVSH